MIRNVEELPYKPSEMLTDVKYNLRSSDFRLPISLSNKCSNFSPVTTRLRDCLPYSYPNTIIGSYFCYNGKGCHVHYPEILR